MPLIKKKDKKKTTWMGSISHYNLCITRLMKLRKQSLTIMNPSSIISDVLYSKIKQSKLRKIYCKNCNKKQRRRATSLQKHYSKELNTFSN